MKHVWRDLKTDPPSGNEYAVLLFPCLSNVGILYRASNLQYAIHTAIHHGYTHWMEFDLHPNHNVVEESEKNRYDDSEYDVTCLLLE